jgi:hypothetical protein
MLNATPYQVDSQGEDTRSLRVCVERLEGLLFSILWFGLEKGRAGGSLDLSEAIDLASALLPSGFLENVVARSPAIAAIEDALDRCYGQDGHPPPPASAHTHHTWIREQVDQIADSLLAAWAAEGICLQDCASVRTAGEVERVREAGLYLSRTEGECEARTGWIESDVKDRKVQLRVRRVATQIVIESRARGDAHFVRIAEHGIEHGRHLARLLRQATE